MQKLSGLIQEEDEEEEKKPVVIELTEKELDEDMPARILEPNNPCAPRVSVYYSYIDNKFIRNEMVDQLVMHCCVDGETILKDSEDHKIQDEIQENRNHMIKETVNQHELMDNNQEFDLKQARSIMRNKFNYSERQSQTPIQYLKERGISTKRPQLKNFSETVTLSWIYDLYLNDWEKNHKEHDEDKGKKKGAGASTEADAGASKSTNKSGSIYSTSFKRCMKIMERMIVQNEEADKYSDYKYMFTSKGPSEVNRSKEKNIYPLWRFLYPPNKKKNVTCICWNPNYQDMFAVGFGSYEFGKKKSAGSICLFSIKNTNYPELVLQTDDSVMSLDFHEQAPALLAVGLYDGVVQVYDVRNKNK